MHNNGAGGENRTRMELPPEDFESSASTNFTTPAQLSFYIYIFIFFLSTTLIKTKDLPRNKFAILSVEAPAWQGTKT